MDSLYLLQFSCFIITTLLFSFIVVSRLFVKWVNKKYERSRWLLATSMLILSVHYLLQMIFGFRASGDDVGAVINILLYSPVIFLISYSIINIECSKRNRRLYILTGIFGYLSILSVFAVGWLTYGSLHMQVALQVMRALFFMSVLFLIFAPIHEIRKIYLQIEKATGSDMKPYRMYLSTGYILLSITAVMLTITMLSYKWLFLLAPLFFVSIFMFVLCFVVLGFNMEIIEEADVTVAADLDEESLSLKTKTEEILSQEKISEIESILESWREKGLFKDSELTLTLLSNRIGIGRKILTAYFSQSCHCTFRIWLSNIRFDEAKRLFKLHPEYSNDAVSQECGFSSRGQLYNIFRDKTGMSPGEWRDLNVNKAQDDA